MRDLEVRIVSAKMSFEFQDEINQILKLGEWRIAEAEMSVTDHHYWAMLIRSEAKWKDGLE